MIAKRLIRDIAIWWRRRKVERVIPELKMLNRAISDRRARHLPTAALIAARKNLVTEQLRKEAYRA